MAKAIKNKRIESAIYIGNQQHCLQTRGKYFRSTVFKKQKSKELGKKKSDENYFENERGNTVYHRL